MGGERRSAKALCWRLNGNLCDVNTRVVKDLSTHGCTCVNNLSKLGRAYPVPLCPLERVPFVVQQLKPSLICHHGLVPFQIEILPIPTSMSSPHSYPALVLVAPSASSSAGVVSSTTSREP